MKRVRAFVASCLWAAGAAGAADLRVLEMSVAWADHWKQAAPEPGEDDVHTLNWSVSEGVGLQATVLRRATLLRSGSDTFYENLKRKWLASFGPEASVAWVEVGDTRWYACRRPGLEKKASVFQLVTVFRGHAYSVLFFAAPEVQSLPVEAMDLLRHIRFGSREPTWVETHAFPVHPDPARLSELFQEEAARIGKQGMLMGYGVEPRANQLSWFFDGFYWGETENKSGAGDQNTAGNQAVKGNKPIKLPFASQGKLTLEQAATLGREVNAHLDVQSGDAPVSAQVRIYDVCADKTAFAQALARLQQGDISLLHQQAQDRQQGCPLPAQGVQVKFEAKPGEVRHLAVNLAPSVALYADEARIHAQIVEARLEKREAAYQPGDSVLPHTGMVMVYQPKIEHTEEAPMRIEKQALPGHHDTRTTHTE